MSCSLFDFKGKPAVFLAPMEDITDSAFRRICKRFGADFLITEFVSSEALIRDAAKSLCKMKFEQEERPIGIQIFGSSVTNMVAAAKIAEEYNPDFIDLNFGCPVRKVVDKGGGAALLKDQDKMLKMTEAVAKSVDIPVSVKTRLGWDDSSKIIAGLAPRLQDSGAALLTVHGRTRAQMYGGHADWEAIAEVRRNPELMIPLVGNGDVDGAGAAKTMISQTGVQGVMIGRASIGNPWIFREVIQFLTNGSLPASPTLVERTGVCRTHLLLAMECKGERKAILEMRRHYGGYFRGLPGFKHFRTKLVTAVDPYEIFSIFEEISQLYKPSNP